MAWCTDQPIFLLKVESGECAMHCYSVSPSILITRNVINGEAHVHTVHTHIQQFRAYFVKIAILVKYKPLPLLMVWEIQHSKRGLKISSHHSFMFIAVLLILATLND